MYHGEIVPGFPQHPHRGFETVTVVRRGLLDHSDSMGATARYGRGDVQWLTAGRGIQHAEMFPLVERERENPVELFQIWLNLPIRDKMADPYFAMLWSDTVPKQVVRDSEGRTTEIVMTAGHYGDVRAPSPPPVVVGVAPGQQRGDLDDQARAARALHAARGAGDEPVAVFLPRQRRRRRRPRDREQPPRRAARPSWTPR